MCVISSGQPNVFDPTYWRANHARDHGSLTSASLRLGPGFPVIRIIKYPTFGDDVLPSCISIALNIAGDRHHVAVGIWTGFLLEWPPNDIQ